MVRLERLGGEEQRAGQVRAWASAEQAAKGEAPFYYDTRWGRGWSAERSSAAALMACALHELPSHTLGIVWEPAALLARAAFAQALRQAALAISIAKERCAACRGDPANTAFGGLYRMDVAIYRRHDPAGFAASLGVRRRGFVPGR